MAVNGSVPLKNIDILVAGAGIGRRTTVLSFTANGFRIWGAEQSDRIAETGAGIPISPNGNRVLNP